MGSFKKKNQLFPLSQASALPRPLLNIFNWATCYVLAGIRLQNRNWILSDTNLILSGIKLPDYMWMQGQRERVRMAKKKTCLESDWSILATASLINSHTAKYTLQNFLFPHASWHSPLPESFYSSSLQKHSNTNVLCIFVAPLDNTPRLLPLIWHPKNRICL